ncbi:hypothetical protein ACQ856_30425 (plasmid) [Mycolicibacterium psychrotolerans]|uniref:hypothetical protein n=1 Tax=Mycolicibacterium psychrotolerans TaxID=216929 RepID=UPI003D67E9F5
MGELVGATEMYRRAGVEDRPQSPLGAAVGADGDLAGGGELVAEPVDAVAQGEVVGGADGDEEGGVDGTFVGVGDEEPVVFGELVPGGGQLRVAVAGVAALGELVAEVAFGAVVAQEFGVAAAQLEVDGEVEDRSGVEVVEGVEEFRAGEYDAGFGDVDDWQDRLVAVRVPVVGTCGAQQRLPARQPGQDRRAGGTVLLVAVVEERRWRGLVARRGGCGQGFGAGAAPGVVPPEPVDHRGGDRLGGEFFGDGGDDSVGQLVVAVDGGGGLGVAAGDPVAEFGELAGGGVSAAAGVDGDRQPVDAGARRFGSQDGFELAAGGDPVGVVAVPGEHGAQQLVAVLRCG